MDQTMALTTGELESKTFHLTWKIQNFSKQGQKIGDSIYSPIFKTGASGKESQWRLVLYPYGEIEKNKDCMSLSLNVLSANNLQFKSCAIKIALLNNSGNTINTHTHYANVFSVSNQWKGWRWQKFCKQKDLTNEKYSLLKNNTLTISCCVSLDLYSLEEFTLQDTLIKNLKTLYATPSLKDLTFLVEGKKITAHKSILSARSTVFCAMFQHDMVESKTNIIEINDISCEVMNELVRYLYCGIVENIQTHAKPLLIAADKYDIKTLKLMCERILFENLKDENACETLIVADCFNCSKLKSETIAFIIKNIKTITCTAAFKELKITNADLLEEILCKLVCSS